MKLLWAENAWENYLYWQASDGDFLCRTNILVQGTRRNPLTGSGKPEPLRGDLAGWWSRRIAGHHRIVYRLRGSGDEQRL